MAMAWSSSVNSRLSTNIQKKGCEPLGRGREYCRMRWNWNRYHPGGHPGASGSARRRGMGAGAGWGGDCGRTRSMGPVWAPAPLLPRIVVSP